jgi:adenylate cyclase
LSSQLVLDLHVFVAGRECPALLAASHVNWPQTRHYGRDVPVMVSEKSETRRLAAILAADVVGYSRMMGSDEVGTLRLLKTYRRELIDPAIAARRGRIVKTIGDGLLVEFQSAVDSVACAATIQRSIALRNENLPAERKLTLRIGINLGDVMSDAEDIYGDGVNLAACLESICQPGGICISRSIRDQIHQKSPLTFCDIGEVSLKNIAEPVHAFSVTAEEITAAPELEPVSFVSSSWRRSRVALITATLGVAVILTVAASIWWTSAKRAPIARAPETSARASIPTLETGTRASIAVLPFVSLAGDGPASTDYFSDGLTEDIIAALGRFRDLSVIARGTVFAYKGRHATPAEVGRDLNVRYVVEGSVRHAADHIRAVASLTDTARGAILWSQKYDADLKDIFSVQDQITRSVAGALVVQVTGLELARSSAKAPSNLEAYDLVLRGRDLWSRNTRLHNAQARTLFERAIALDPGYAPAYVGLGRVNYLAITQGWTFDPHGTFKLVERLARKALELDDASSSAHALLGLALIDLGDYDRALAEARLAVDLNPSDPEACSGLLNVLLWNGDLQGAIAAGEMLARFQRHLTATEAFDLGTAYLLADRGGDAVRVLEPAADRNPTAFPAMAMLTAAYAQVGRQQAADRQAADVRQRFPAFSAELFGSVLRDAGLRDKLGRLLKKGGL